MLRKATTQTHYDSREDRSLERITLGTTIDCGHPVKAVEPDDAWDVPSDVAEAESHEMDVTAVGNDAPENETYELDISAVCGHSDARSAIGVLTLGQAAAAIAVHGSTPALVVVVVCGAVRHECGADAWRLLDGLLRDGPVQAGANLAMLRGALDIAADVMEPLGWQLHASPRQLFGPETRAVARDGAGIYGAAARYSVSLRAAKAGGYCFDSPISAEIITYLIGGSNATPSLFNPT